MMTPESFTAVGSTNKKKKQDEDNDKGDDGSISNETGGTQAFMTSDNDPEQAT